jgi:hypothetical protein
MRGIVYGNNIFVAVGEFGRILSSPDGTTWSNQTFSQTNSYNNIIYVNGMFVIIGYNGTIVTSSIQTVLIG